MALDLQNFFRLGLDSTNQPIEATGLLNTRRVAPSTVSTLHNRVVFRFENEGLLTKDSGVIVQPVQGTANGNVGLNVVNGILGSIRRATLTIDGKRLTDLVQPSHLENNRLYSKNTESRMLDYYRPLIGNGLAVQVVKDGEAENTIGLNGVEYSGTEIFSKHLPTQYNNADPGAAVVRQYGIGQNNNKNYYVPLHLLGMNFLRYNNLPLYLMKDRLVELTLEFDNKAAQNWAFDSTNGVGVGRSTVTVDLNACELIQNNILLDDELVQSQLAMIRDEAANFSLVESYLVEGTIPILQRLDGGGAVINQSKNYRINCQGREVQKLLVAQTFSDNDGSNTGVVPFANQGSVDIGEKEYNWRINGSLLFDKDIKDETIQYYLLTEYNGGYGVRVSRNTFASNSLVQKQYADLIVDAQRNQVTDYIGRFNYLGQSLRNGSAGVFGAGTLINTPIDLKMSHVSAPNKFPPCQGDAANPKNLRSLIYVSNSKMLQINANSVNITF